MAFFIWTFEPLYLRHFKTLKTITHIDKDRNVRSPHFLNVSDLQFQYGNKENWWGHFNFKQTRHAYRKLMPTYADDYRSDYTLVELAEKACLARMDAKQYSREMAVIPVRYVSMFYDGIRHWVRYGLWSSSGMTFDEIWQKYERQVKMDMPWITGEELQQQTAALVLQKACKSNPWIDKLVI